MAYRVKGIIRIDDNGNLNAGILTATDANITGVATATEFDGKVSSKAITEQSAGGSGDVTGADELLLYDNTSNDLLRISVDDFVAGAGIGTVIADFENLNVSGASTLTGAVSLGSSLTLADNESLYLGDAQDLQIVHDGSNSFIVERGTGNLIYRSGTQLFQNLDGTKTAAQFNTASSVDLSFDDSVKFQTVATGATVTGTMFATNFDGDGSGLTGIDEVTDDGGTESGVWTWFQNDGGVNLGQRFNATPGSTNNLVENGHAWEWELANENPSGDMVMRYGQTSTGTAGEQITWETAYQIDSETGNMGIKRNPRTNSIALTVNGDIEAQGAGFVGSGVSLTNLPISFVYAFNSGANLSNTGVGQIRRIADQTNWAVSVTDQNDVDATDFYTNLVDGDSYRVTIQGASTYIYFTGEFDSTAIGAGLNVYRFINCTTNGIGATNSVQLPSNGEEVYVTILPALFVDGGDINAGHIDATSLDVSGISTLGNLTIDGTNVESSAAVNITAGGTSAISLRPKNAAQGVRIYESTETNWSQIAVSNITGNRTVEFQDKNGTFAYLDDIEVGLKYSFQNGGPVPTTGDARLNAAQTTYTFNQFDSSGTDFSAFFANMDDGQQYQGTIEWNNGFIEFVGAAETAGVVDGSGDTAYRFTSCTTRGTGVNNLVAIPSSGDDIYVTLTRVATINGINGGTVVGTVAAFAAQTPPDGWLECDGSSVSRSVYADLFAVIGTTYGSASGTEFNLPDLRGEFVRGWDNGAGVDSGRVFGSNQDDSMADHVHAQNGGLSPGFTGSNVANSNQDTDEQVESGTGETRPRNVALLYCIKYVSNDIGIIGATGPTGSISAINSDLLPSLDATYALGSSSFKWSTVFTTSVDLDGPTIDTGSVTPEGNVAADLGSLYAIDSGTDVSGLYVKRTGGSTNSGWRHSSVPEIYAVFDGTNTGTITPDKSSGFSSISRTSQGRYTLVFENQMPDNDYLVLLTSGTGASQDAFITAQTINQVRIGTSLNNNGAVDAERVHIAVFMV